MNIHDLYRPFLKHFRAKRMQEFLRRFEPGAQTRILDVGGAPLNWSLVPQESRLCFVNLYARKEGDESWVIADGRYLPFEDHAFDVVYSNSVIEHLGTFSRPFQDQT